MFGLQNVPAVGSCVVTTGGLFIPHSSSVEGLKAPVRCDVQRGGVVHHHELERGVVMKKPLSAVPLSSHVRRVKSLSLRFSRSCTAPHQIHVWVWSEFDAQRESERGPRGGCRATVGSLPVSTLDAGTLHAGDSRCGHAENEARLQAFHQISREHRVRGTVQALNHSKDCLQTVLVPVFVRRWLAHRAVNVGFNFLIGGGVL